MPGPTMRRPTRRAMPSPARSKTSARFLGSLAAKLGDAESVKVVWKPQTLTPLDQEKAESLMKLVDASTTTTTCRMVFSNADISDEVMAKLGGE